MRQTRRQNGVLFAQGHVFLPSPHCALTFPPPHHVRGNVGEGYAEGGSQTCEAGHICPKTLRPNCATRAEVIAAGTEGEADCDLFNGSRRYAQTSPSVDA